ncbi:MAG: hypothetical protein NUV82_02675 [Candidatus Komeilibacteria bacterium]|nr:hypothetical protein [Candidatus Komeilibacteria bacterium]
MKIISLVILACIFSACGVFESDWDKIENIVNSHYEAFERDSKTVPLDEEYAVVFFFSQDKMLEAAFIIRSGRLINSIVYSKGGEMKSAIDYTALADGKIYFANDGSVYLWDRKVRQGDYLSEEIFKLKETVLTLSNLLKVKWLEIIKTDTSDEMIVS